MVAAVKDSVSGEILSDPNIKGIKNAFMEYTEPSIAAAMKEFDKEGYTDVIVVPLLLTVSGHSFDDIPHILGLKNTQAEIDKLKSENVEVYKAKAKVAMTPLLDFPKILGENVIERVKKLSKDPKNEACVLVAYGDDRYDKEWTTLLNEIGEKVKNSIGIEVCAHAWCGHIAEYSSKPTTKAIDEVMTKKQNAIVIPILVAVDENFQGSIIGGGVKAAKRAKDVYYKPDAILPDINVQKWVVSISKETANKINSEAK
jgi:cobalamin biosynthesis Co2+ chelatase CbiK